MDFVEVSEEDLTEYLKMCPDYIRSERGANLYSYRHNGFIFAVVTSDGCFVSPTILKLPLASHPG